MCRMLAVSSQNIKEQELYFNIFPALASVGKVKPHRPEGHHDGWGVAGFLGYKAVIFEKSPNDIVKEKNLYNKSVSKVLNSYTKFAIAHLRKASQGEVKLANTHPFIKDNWIFAHNGTIMDVKNLKIKNNFCKGTTDSERLFNFIVENIGNKINFISELVEIIKYLKVKTKHTSLTFFLSNEDFLCAYREYSLKYAEEDDKPIWNRDYYTLYYTQNEKSIIFCSEQLTEEKWTPLRNSHLIVVTKDARIIFDKKI